MCALNKHITQMYNLDVYGNSPHEKQSVLADSHRRQRWSGHTFFVWILCVDEVSSNVSAVRLFASRCPIICMSCHSLSAAKESIRMLYIWRKVAATRLCPMDTVLLPSCITLAVEVTDFLNFDVFLFKCYHWWPRISYGLIRLMRDQEILPVFILFQCLKRGHMRPIFA